MEIANYENTYKVLQDYAEAVRQAYRDNLAQGRNASKNLSDTMTARVEVQGNAFAVVLNMADYWKYIEHGTRPHFPPISVILKWIEVKPIIPRPDSKGHVPSLKSLAYLIARKISEVGTEGKPDLQDASERTFNEFHEALVSAMAQDASRMVMTLFNV